MYCEDIDDDLIELRDGTLNDTVGSNRKKYENSSELKEHQYAGKVLQRFRQGGRVGDFASLDFSRYKPQCCGSGMLMIVNTCSRAPELSTIP